MPQVDKVTFLPQVFWLVVLFLVFYVTILRDVLSSVNAVLKIRLKNIEVNQLNKNLLGAENVTVFTAYSNYFAKIFELTKGLYIQKLNYIENWLNLKYTFDNISKITSTQIEVKNSIKNQKYVLTTLI
jgi:hypothetical protein